jgi:hypothetical protein
MRTLTVALLLLAAPNVGAQGIFKLVQPPTQEDRVEPVDMQVTKAVEPKVPVRAATQATLPEAFIVYPVATAEPGQAGWVAADAVVIDKRRAIWLKRSAVLERAPSKETPFYVALDTDGWTLWLLNQTKFQVTGDAQLTALLPDLIPVPGLRKKLTE